MIFISGLYAQHIEVNMYYIIFEALFFFISIMSYMNIILFHCRNIEVPEPIDQGVSFTSHLPSIYHPFGIRLPSG
jgi:hypothetical protein